MIVSMVQVLMDIQIQRVHDITIRIHIDDAMYKLKRDYLNQELQEKSRLICGRDWEGIRET